MSESKLKFDRIDKINKHDTVDDVHEIDETAKRPYTQHIIVESGSQKITLKSQVQGKFLMNSYLLTVNENQKLQTIVQTIKYSLKEYIIYQDKQNGQIVIQNTKKALIWNCFDCLLFWRTGGSNKGSLANLYNIITIKVKKNQLQRNFSIIIKSSQIKLQIKFFKKIIKIVEMSLKKLEHQKNQEYKIKAKKPQQDQFLIKQIQAYKTLSLFIYSSDTRYKNLLQNSISIIQQVIKLSFINIQNQSFINSIIQTVVNQTSTLYQAFTYDQQKCINLHYQYFIYAIQSQICNNLIKKIFSYYKLLTKQQNKIFNQQCKYINQNVNNQECWRYLECKEKYTLISQKQPYYLAILHLRQLEYANSFRQMLYCIQKCFNSIKMSCLIEHKGNINLVTMDDILPVMVFVVARANVTDFPSYVKLLDDYIKSRDGFDIEERDIITLYVTIEDITRKWGKKSFQAPQI